MKARSMTGAPLAIEARPTVVVFFASWCGPCRAELANLGRLHEKHPGVRIIGLNSYEDFRDYSDTQQLRAFLDSNAPWMTEVVSADEAMLIDFGRVPRIPTLLVFDASGKISAEFRRDQRRPPSYEELESAVTNAAKAAKAL